MNWKIQILLVVAAGVSGLSTFNSTLVTDSKHLFQPIVIPNITTYFEQPHIIKNIGQAKTKDPGQQRATHPLEPLQELTTLTENGSDEESKLRENSLKFSSRYSTKEKDLLKYRGKAMQTNASVTEVPESSEGKNYEPGSGELQRAGERRSFSERSDDLDSSEEEKEDVGKYFDTNEPEESEVSPTTNEPLQHSDRPTQFQSSPYPDVDYSDYKIIPTLPEEEEEEEEEKHNSEEEEEKRSVDDYYNSGSKNYHSVQTPLSKIHYRGPHSLRGDFDSAKGKTRLLSPIRRPAVDPKRPYSRSQPKAELEDENEISETDENYLDEGIRKELRNPKTTGLELAVEKDEQKFDEKRKYNLVEERDRGKHQLQSLSVEEEKDHRRLPLQTLKQYQVDEEIRYQPPKTTPKEGRKVATTTPRNIFFDKPKQTPEPDVPQLPHFRPHQFLGPVVFDPNGDQLKAKASAKPHLNNANKDPIRNAFARGLSEREKLDQDNLTNDRHHKSIFGTGSADHTTHNFNHLVESEEMYNAILANIHSVFGVRTQSKSEDERGSRPSSAGLEESRYLTWSVPVTKRAQVQ